MDDASCSTGVQSCRNNLLLRVCPREPAVHPEVQTASVQRAQGVSGAYPEGATPGQGVSLVVVDSVGVPEAQGLEGEHVRQGVERLQGGMYQ